MRQELKIKPKHWLMALGLVIGGFLLALACIFGIIELLSPYADFIADNYWQYMQCSLDELLALFNSISFGRGICKKRN